MIEFEDFMFGKDRVALERVGEGLLDLQKGSCFYCAGRIARNREIDHFIPWSLSGDDGITNLVAACRRCNNAKRATLAGPAHLSALLERNDHWLVDLGELARERRWPSDPVRSGRIARTTYLHSPDERRLWLFEKGEGRHERLGKFRPEFDLLFNQAS